MKAFETIGSRSSLSFNRRHEFRQRYRFGLRLVLALAICLGAAFASRAGVVVYNNVGTAPYDEDGYATFGLYSDGNYYARGMQFTPSQTVALSSIELAIGVAYFTSGNAAQAGAAEVQLMTDSNGSPATVLESWTSATLSGGPGDVSLQTFTSVLTPKLAAGVNYWIVLSAATNSNLGGAWTFAETSAPSDVNTIYITESTGSKSTVQLTRGFQTEITGNEAPSLSITRTATNTFVVSWPSFATGWVLESTNSLTHAAGAWPQVSQPYSSTSTNYFIVVTNSPTVKNQFFRLLNP